MPAINPVPTAADFCGLTGPEATELLAATLANLANGTALEDCAVQARSVSLERGNVPGMATDADSTQQVLQVINLGTLPYDSCIDLNTTVRITFDSATAENSRVEVNLVAGNGCGGAVLARVQYEKAIETGEVEVVNGLQIAQQICFPAGVPREVTICGQKFDAAPGGTTTIALGDIFWTGSCGDV